MSITDHIMASGLSRTEICHRVGISTGMLSHIESGRRRISIRRAALLAQVLGVQVSTVRPDLAEVLAAPQPPSE